MRLLLSFVIAGALATVALALLLNAMKRQTLFFPSRYPDGEWNASRFSPAPRDVVFVSGALRLHGWHFPSENRDAPLVIWHHGNGGNLTYRASAASELARRGVSVLVYDYRGYGKSEGSPSERGLYVDSVAVYDYAVREKLAAPEKIFSYGESLGGPYAAWLASQRPLRGVILENSFHSAADLANRLFRLPLGVLLGRSLATASYLRKADVPILVMHGGADQTIPVGSALRLYHSAEVPKELWVAPAADHNELTLETEYFTRITRFVERFSTR